MNTKRESIISWSIRRPERHIGGTVVNTFRLKLNGQCDSHCFQCGRGGVIIRDNIVDICSLRCGWRESYYFEGEPELLAELINRLMFNSAGVL